MKLQNKQYYLLATGTAGMIFVAQTSLLAQAESRPRELITEPTLIAQSPNQNLSSFFQTGRPRSEDTLRFQSPPSGVPALRTNSSSWQFIVFSQGNVSFWMPPGILAQDQVVINTTAGDLTFQTLVSNDGDYRYVAAYAGGLTPEQINDPTALFEAMRERVAPAETFSLTNERPMTLGNYQGSEFTFANDTESVVFRTYLVGNQIYAMGIMQPLNSPRDNVARTFLNALQFVDN
jgi:hypothetical protein